nr:Hypothetical protein CBG09484 [Haemonchus contortus]
MMYITLPLVVLLPYAIAAPESSPVHITIETDPSKSFYVGPYDRTRIDLIEEFHPLQTASVAQGAQLQELRRRAAGVKSVNNQPTLVEASPVDFEMNDRDAVSSESSSKPQRIVFGEWSNWTEWTSCIAGERSRVRSCNSRRPALRIVCHGPAKEVQRCFSMIETHVPVAEDPWSIEREISGNFKA